MEYPLRRQPFEGVANFRDLGGYPVGDRGMTRWGVFYRAARLSHATPNDHRRLKALGVRTIIDLRTGQEIRSRPDLYQDDETLGWRHLSLLGDFDVDIDALERNPDEVPPMSTLYLNMVQQGAAHFRALFLMLAERVRHGAVLFHCTAGKDRTGITAMLLLALCGVDRVDLLADYEVSAVYNHPFMPGDQSGSDPAHMASLLDHLDARYGGPVGYLEATGVSQGALEALRSALYMDIPKLG